jgi:hypothetical protein
MIEKYHGLFVIQYLQIIWPQIGNYPVPEILEI